MSISRAISEQLFEKRIDSRYLDEMYAIELAVYTDPWSRKLLEESLQAPMTHSLGLFSSEDKVMAYAIFQVVLDEAHLLNLAVHPEFQGRAYGSRLLDQVILEAKKRGSKSFYLEVRPSNDRARKLYENKGFRMLAVREGYYSNGEAALVMFLDLQG